MPPYLLYQTACSLYSGKARAYLRYKGVPFEERLSTMEAYREVIRPRTGLSMIPLLITPEDVAVQDTTDILDLIELRFPERSVYPEGPLQRLVALLIEVYADEWLVMPAMHYRWHYKRENLLFILREFGETGFPEAPPALRPLLGLPPALVFGGAYKRVFGITRRNRGALERWTEAFLRELDAHLAAHPFLLGGRPSVGDYGLMAPLYAHLYRDPYPGALMRRIAPAVAAWVERMNAPPQEAPELGDFLPGDEVPASLDPILRRMFAHQAPVILDTIERVDAWAARHPGRRLPRFLGEHRYRMGEGMDGVEETRLVMPYAQWMWQRPAFFYQGLTGQARARAAARMKALGGLGALERGIPTALKREANKLWVAASPTDGRTGHPEAPQVQPHCRALVG